MGVWPWIPKMEVICHDCNVQARALEVTVIMRYPLHYWFFAFVTLFLLLEVHAAGVKETDTTEHLLSVLVRPLPTNH